jgi:hypothetical protein
MATEHRHREDLAKEREEGYERRDASIPGLLQGAFWLAVVLFVTLIVMRFVFGFFKKVEPLGPTASPLVTPAQQAQQMLPPSPRLQVQPHAELVDYCAAQQREVDSYAWIDKQDGIVRIPVDRAMDLVLTRGLPTRSAGETPANAPKVEPATGACPEDVEGQCGYLTEPGPAQPAAEGEGQQK